LFPPVVAEAANGVGAGCGVAALFSLAGIVLHEGGEGEVELATLGAGPVPTRGADPPAAWAARWIGSGIALGAIGAPSGVGAAPCGVDAVAFGVGLGAGSPTCAARR